MLERSAVRRFDLILVSLAGVLILSYVLGFFASSLPTTLNWFLTYSPRAIPLNNFIIKKLTIDGQVDEILRFLVTTGLCYLGFVVVSIEAIRMAVKCPPQSVPFNVGLKSFNAAKGRRFTPRIFLQMRIGRGAARLIVKPCRSGSLPASWRGFGGCVRR